MNLLTADLAAHDITMLGQVRVHGPQAFENMRKIGAISAGALDMLAEKIVPGITTDEIDRLVYDYALAHDCLPATLHYRGYRHSCCTSVNHVVCHGIPGDRTLRDGDIVNVDVTLIKDGWHGDTNRMYFVGKVNRKAERLCEITYEAMMRGIAAVKPGATLGDVGHAIQEYAESERCSIVREFCGHGIGRVFHDIPNVLHYGRPGEGMALHEGMCFTVEPMVNLGKAAVKILNDGWTAVTRDRSLSAQFEHTIGVTATGAEIFTKSPKGLDHPPYA
ncbi:MAG: type I methionyl aminopeptidase [Alphaproteobacteria bacterium]|nr:type I methionyl aminopeptidase [Alphaproteobacteria bacterium]MBO6629546.1 type I methionyl aminopeptidase [Alphaproteobacteria bacterium]MDF1625779.1 type I methionyl aminopeptidase [Parvibaculaceae bacterium]|tara:strand:+ start:73 stop:900 length:828 start_codon:yes stop_codon:yes gene_type:complete